ncbi:beta-ketoacyl-[acyl-carrier-protein] synthase family protein, partial [Streptomyces sp. NPDC059455]|uniref:beta-ketoacyl-[acyl-carrier-protein] synthase family protein n=1 Tax=Streptomyces sp. NPDC059455 TaxID=3346837 RepID=UPI003675B21B
GRHSMHTTMARGGRAARLSAAVAHELGLTDVEAVTIPTACAAGNYAIGYGFDAVRTGEVDFALCGGADAMCRKTFAGFYRLGTIAPELCQPFDVDRKGILTGEGAGVLVLESLESALARGARIYAEVLGYGLNCDAYHQVAPNQSSVARCMALALENAGVKPGEVDLVSAHGTGTKANDITEARAIREVYGAAPPRTISIKSMLGHTMGAASALAAIACSLAIVHRFIPPTINHTVTDPECEVDCVPNQAVEADLRIVQNNGLAFGGNNAVVILGKYEEHR